MTCRRQTTGRLPSTGFVLLRHAHAVTKRGWEGTDAARPLTPRGAHQAVVFAELAGGLPIRRILTSPALRCEQTVAPLAAARDLSVRRTPALAVDGSLDALLTLLGSDAAAGSVLCTHGERLRSLFTAWQEQGRRGLPGPSSRMGKGDAWLIGGYPGTEATASYLAIPLPGAAATHS
jgi:8-oxo-dGTP diphosphatase